MSEIKFRGKTKRNGKWIYGLLGYCNFNYGVERAIFQKTELGSIIVERIIDDTVCQFTGLKDKNGVEIYEGDIIKFHNKYTGDSISGKVEYLQDCATYGLCYCIVDGAKSKEIYFICIDCKKKDMEVIGNIYDNPELLEVEE